MFTINTKLSILKALITKKSPYYIQYYINGQCNLMCKQCNIVETNSGLKNATLEEIDMIASNIRKIGGGIVLLTGGEPFLRKDLPEIVKIFKKYTLDVRLQTAGHKVSTEKLIQETYDAGAKDINISLDSLIPEKQDYINSVPGSWHSAIQTAVIGLGMTAVFYFSFTGFIAGKITLGSITLIYASVFKLLPMLFGLMHGYREYVKSIVDVDALFSVFKEKNEVKDLSFAKRLTAHDGKVEFKKVTFAYPQKKSAVIKDFSLKVKKNQKVALVGPSGSGKTTIVKLLYRLFDLNEGSIEIDGIDISKVTQHSLRSNMSIVPQEPLLFSK